MTRVLLEASAAQRPGNDRGIGRYLAAVRSANVSLGYETTEIQRHMGTGRLSEFVTLPRRQLDLLNRRYDLFHALTPYYMGWTPRERGTVVSILDVIPLEVSGHAQTGIKAQLFHRWAVRADSVLTLSSHAAQRIVDLLGVHSEQVFVAPLPPTADFIPVGERAPKLPARYVAALADLRTPDPRKRGHWLRSIGSALADEGAALVVAGSATETLVARGLVGVGRIDDATWAAVLRGAQFLAYTSAYEGQGMPPLEAIACGTPVVAMRNSAIPEVVGAAGLLVEESSTDARSLQALTYSCIRLLRDNGLLNALRQRCSEQAATFNPRRFEESLAMAYRQAVKRPQ